MAEHYWLPCRKCGCRWDLSAPYRGDRLTPETVRCIEPRKRWVGDVAGPCLLQREREDNGQAPLLVEQ